MYDLTNNGNDDGKPASDSVSDGNNFQVMHFVWIFRTFRIMSSVIYVSIYPV